MRVLKIFTVLLLAISFTSCACRTKRVGTGADSNIPLAGEASLLNDIYFDYDSYVIPESGKADAQTAAAWLEENSGNNIVLEGHCDERGTTEYNMVLGSNRAQAVYNYLRSLGVSADRMSTVSYGEEIPVSAGHDESAWSQNRRVHFDIQ